MRYAVVVVGAGSAGCVLAARLSEDPACSVLLLDSGPDYPDPATLPLDLATAPAVASSHDWGYASEPDSRGRTIPLPRARVVGGCSATNATAAVRGLPADYDAWADANNPGWSFAEVLPYFRRLERDLDYHDAWHGGDGPLPISRATEADLTALQRAFLQACSAAGYPLVDDHNAPGTMGAGPWPTNGLGGVRQSAAHTYLAPVRGRPNLTIRAGTLVDRVLLQGRRATGVQVADPAGTVAAERVILAAGAYGSPAILLRSGLGPAEQLGALGIATAADLPGVGCQLADHPFLGVVFEPTEARAGVPWLQTLLTWRSDAARSGYDLHIFPGGPWASPNGAAFALVAALVKPLSRGRVQLRSADPATAPRIELGYFTDPDDLPRLVEAVRLARQLARTPPLSGLVRAEVYPGPEVPDTAAALEAAIQARVETYHHPVGTCRMGPAGDRVAVVDARGRVHGIDGLHVVDASIMPAIPAANTNLPTLMVAERCAAWLRGSP